MPTPEPQTSPTNKLLQQILDVAKQNLAVSQDILASNQSILASVNESLQAAKLTLAVEIESRDYLAQLTELLSGFSHNYTVQVEQVLLTKPKTQR